MSLSTALFASARPVAVAFTLATALLPRAAAAQDLARFAVDAPDRREYVVFLTELDVQLPNGVEAAALALPAGATLGVVRPRFATVTATAATTAALAQIARAIESSNTGAEASFVVHETGQPRSTASRHVLTREVAVLLADGIDVNVLTAVTAAVPRAVAGVDRAYVIEADEPLMAPALAAALRAVSGVSAAYPLLRRTWAVQ